MHEPCVYHARPKNNSNRSNDRISDIYMYMYILAKSMSINISHEIFSLILFQSVSEFIGACFSITPQQLEAF